MTNEQTPTKTNSNSLTQITRVEASRRARAITSAMLNAMVIDMDRNSSKWVDDWADSTLREAIIELAESLLPPAHTIPGRCRP